MHAPACSFLLGLAALVWASSHAVAGWESRTIDCTLRPTTIQIAQDGSIKPSDSLGQDMVITFTGFDEKTGQASLVGNLGSVPVLFQEVGGNLQIVQITSTSNVTATTIVVEGQNLWAVHSRHMWIVDAGVLSVYEGPCRLR